MNEHVKKPRSHSSHWGAFSGEMVDGRLIVRPHPGDPDPNPLIENLPAALNHRARVARPAFRRGWLEHGPGPSDRRGRDEFVELDWDEALDRLAAEMRRVGEQHGAAGVFGGSYGWSSAGRFHHAQSQVHRFLNVALGGYVRSVNSYSAGASMVVLPHILGGYDDVSRRNVSWDDIAAETDIVLAFGGMSLKNSRVASGGVSLHSERAHMIAAAQRGCRFILIGPLRSDLPAEINAQWLQLRPGTDTALMLALAHTLLIDGGHDRAFLDRCCHGFEPFERYLRGDSDGVVKSAEWAAAITGIDAATIIAIARQLPGKRVLVTVAHSLQRAEHGEQPVWMGSVLAAMLGQHGLPGGGFAYALGAIANYGRRQNAVPIAAMPQGHNNVDAFIPVARIADMLLQPGAPFDYNGQSLTYPDVKLVYWAGGNPFHHHQDINRLRQAFARLDTLVVHEIGWTGTARHADIVLPVTTTMERDDIGGAPFDPLLVAMQKIAEPFAEARNDFDIFSDLARRLGCEDAFTEGRDTDGWLRHLYETTRAALETGGHDAPSFDAFWERGELALPQLPHRGGPLRAFRDDPGGHPLPTGSGKIEIASDVIAGFGYDDCPGHPAWLPPVDRPDSAHPLQLVANQPASRLHSQFDFGEHSASTKRREREVMRIHPDDAAARGIADGDIVRLFNQRGACLAAAKVTDGVMRGVVQLPTGAWYDPDDPADDKPLCVHGNPNVLTRDAGTSKLAQGCTGQLTAVEVERFTGNLPPLRCYDPPPGIATRDG